MHFIVQENLWNEVQYDYFINILIQLGIKHTIVKVVPFSHELIPEPVIDENEQTLVFGGTTLVRIAKDRNIKMGAFHLDHFPCTVWSEKYGDNMLNNKPYFCTFGTIPYESYVDKDFFIRPIEDSKVFSGKVTNEKLHKEWVERVKDIEKTKEYSTLTLDTNIMVHELRKTLQEYRFFVVDGKIVAQSIYKIGLQGYLESGFMKNIVVRPDAISFAEKMIDIYAPAKAYVMDIALVGDSDFKIIEFNCFNSSGFYGCNMQKVVYRLKWKFEHGWLGQKW